MLLLRVLPGSDFLEQLDQVPLLHDRVGSAPAGVQALALGYRSGEAWNESGFSNPDFDAKLEVALATPDVEKRRKVMKDIEQILQDSGILIQPYWRSIYIHSVAALKDYPGHPNSEKHLERVWLDR